MPTRKSPRKGSLQFWPRKRAAKFLPRVNWDAIKTGKNLKGFIGYKAGMISLYVKDNTDDSMTKDKKIVIPATIIECPKLKIFSVRFYKDSKPVKEILASNLEKELKRKVKLPKNYSKKIDEVKEDDYDDVRVIGYSNVKKTGLKKKPDMLEIGLAGSTSDKLTFIKEHLGKEISIGDVFESGELVDVRGLTTGRGFSGPVKRFGITLKASKSEKGRRRPGSLAPWHPSRVTFRAPQAGQVGMFTRVVYNNKIVDMKKEGENTLKNIKNYGDVKTDYIIVAGSIQGPSKRQMILSSALRATKKQLKKNYELLEIR